MTLYPQPPDQPSTAAGPAGWYVDPDNPVQSRRWDGQQWTGETGKLTPLTRRLGEAQGTQGLTARPPATGPLSAAGQAIYFLAALAAIASILGGIYLFQHTGSSCGSGQFDPCSSTHPWKLTGATVIIAGLLQSAVLAVVGYLCTVVDRLRAGR